MKCSIICLFLQLNSTQETRVHISVLVAGVYIVIHSHWSQILREIPTTVNKFTAANIFLFISETL